MCDLTNADTVAALARLVSVSRIYESSSPKFKPTNDSRIEMEVYPDHVVGDPTPLVESLETSLDQSRKDWMTQYNAHQKVAKELEDLKKRCAAAGLTIT